MQKKSTNSLNWAVEGEGIAPDIEVIQEPKQVLEGKDRKVLK